MGLFVVNELNDMFQECLWVVLGTTTLWDHEYIIIRQGVKW